MQLGYDIYRSEISDELQDFFDCYCKPDPSPCAKAWEVLTPPVRLSLLGFEADGSSAATVVERHERSYPLERQVLRTLYLNGEKGTLDNSKPSQEAVISYEGKSLNDVLVSEALYSRATQHQPTSSMGELYAVPCSPLSFPFTVKTQWLILLSRDSPLQTFTTKFDVDTELAGYPKAVLYVSCADHDDFDIVVQVRKTDASGRQLSHLNYPCPVPIDQVPDVNVAKTLGPQGFLRASHAITKDAAGGPVAPSDLSKETDVLYSHRIRESISPGTIVRLEIPIWPIGMVFAAGEGIAFNISGHDMCLPETEMCRLHEPEDENVGRHQLHTGGNYDSCLILPVIKG